MRSAALKKKKETAKRNCCLFCFLYAITKGADDSYTASALHVLFCFFFPFFLSSRTLSFSENACLVLSAYRGGLALSPGFREHCGYTSTFFFRHHSSVYCWRRDIRRLYVCVSDSSRFVSRTSSFIAVLHLAANPIINFFFFFLWLFVSEGSLNLTHRQN